MKRGLFVCALAAVGCISDPGALPLDELLPPADFERFASEVQPIFADRCANPSCHGNEERPLEIFAIQQHRLDPADLYLADPLKPEELRANFEKSCAFMVDVDSAMRCTLVTKPLAPSEGGVRHADVIVFEDRSDPDLLTLVDWIEQALASKEEMLK